MYASTAQISSSFKVPPNAGILSGDVVCPPSFTVVNSDWHEDAVTIGASAACHTHSGTAPGFGVSTAPLHDHLATIFTITLALLTIQLIRLAPSAV